MTLISINVHSVTSIEVTRPKPLSGGGTHTADVKITNGDGTLFEVTCFADTPEPLTLADNGLGDFARKALEITQRHLLLPPDSGLTEHVAFNELLALIDTHPAAIALSNAPKPRPAEENAPVPAMAEDEEPF